MTGRKYRRCSNCVMDTTDSKIKFDQNGMCDHCHNYYENIKPNWHPNEQGKQILDSLTEQIKRDGKGKKYDCIIGLSGGVDSSYLAYYAVRILGLRPLLFGCDTGWNLNVAVNNMEKITKGLGLPLYTEIVNWNEMKDLQLAFFKAQVPYQDLPQDHVIFAALYNYAAKKGIKYVLTGGNNSTECVREPIEWVYQNDIKMIKDIHKKHGNTPLRTLPMCGMFKAHIYYRYIKGMKVVKPLDLIPYTKAEAIATLQREFDWEPYANKHFESIFTRFYEGYWLLNKFGYDKRKCHFSSLILTGQLERDKALEQLDTEPYEEKQAMLDLEYVSKKLGISKEEFIELMKQPNKTYKDYKNSSGLIELAVKISRMLGLERRQYR